MGKISPGDGLDKVSASEFNSAIDAGNWYRLNVAMGQGGGGRVAVRPTDCVKARNNSGANRRRGDVLKLGAMLLDELDPLSLWFEGEEPDAACNFGILVWPAPDNEIEVVQVSGACIAYVDIRDELHDRARIDPASYVLVSDCGGPLKILAKASTGTGEKECVVCFGNDGRGSLSVILDEDLEFESAAAATVQVGIPGSQTEGASIDVYCNLMTTGETIPSGTKGEVSWNGEYFNWIADRCG